MWLIHKISKYRYTSVFVFLIIISLFLGFSGNDKAEQDKKSQSTYKLSGTVADHNENPLKDIELLLFSAQNDYPLKPQAVSNTRKNGHFEIKTAKLQSYVMEVRGKQGNGRIFIPAEKLDDRIDIIYPVTEKIIVLHTNDLHFTLNNTREFAEMLKKIRGNYPDVYLMSAGDNVVRQPEGWQVNGLGMTASWYKENAIIMINYMNESRYCVMTPGNHELSYVETYTRDALESANFPIIAANLEISTDNFPPVKPYVLFNTSTWRTLAVLGIVYNNKATEGLKVLDVSETVKKYLPLKDSSDIFLALTHVGIRRDRALAEEFPQFDAIIGGHSHDLLKQADLINNVIVAQAGGNKHVTSEAHKVYLGIIVFKLENGNLKDKSGWVMEIKKGVNKFYEFIPDTTKVPALNP